MSDIKIKVKPQVTIKNIDKSIVGLQKIKNNLVTTKQKINEITIADDNNSGEEYAGRKVQNKINYATIKVLKAIIAGAKALVSAMIAGGWVAVVIIIVVVLIAGFIAAIFNSDGDMNYDSSQISNSEIVLVGKSQIGDEG